eukprot:5485036-Prymnesium_polylepis.1
MAARRADGGWVCVSPPVPCRAEAEANRRFGGSDGVLRSCASCSRPCGMARVGTGSSLDLGSRPCRRVESVAPSPESIARKCFLRVRFRPRWTDVH